jgi:hypothetical protein
VWIWALSSFLARSPKIFAFLVWLHPVKLLNQDVGFISQGIKAKVTMAAFPDQEFCSVE